MRLINKIELFAGKVLSAAGVDGMAHIIVCLLLILQLPKFMPLWPAIVITVAISILKEVYDKYGKNGEFSTKDLLCDCIGLALGLVITLT